MGRIGDYLDGLFGGWSPELDFSTARREQRRQTRKWRDEAAEHREIEKRTEAFRYGKRLRRLIRAKKVRQHG